jgi:DNA repair protein RadC
VLTQALRKALLLIDIRLVDHIVVSAGGATSMAELGAV